MNRSAFYVALRKRNSGVFGTSLSQRQVDGIEALLNILVPMMDSGDVTDLQAAYILATVYHETGGTMAPVRETFAKADEEAVRRLERDWRAGKRPWVTTPYWRRDNDGISWYGRGLIQITHKRNYRKLGKRLGVGLVQNPDLALDLNISAQIAVVGMLEGLFTGRALSVQDEEDFDEARRVVNGMDKAELIAEYAIAFLQAIRSASEKVVTAEDEPDNGVGNSTVASIMLKLLNWILSIFKR